MGLGLGLGSGLGLGLGVRAPPEGAPCPCAIIAPPHALLSSAMMGAISASIARTEARQLGSSLSSAAPLASARAEEPA